MLLPVHRLGSVGVLWVLRVKLFHLSPTDQHRACTGKYNQAAASRSHRKPPARHRHRPVSHSHSPLAPLGDIPVGTRGSAARRRCKARAHRATAGTTTSTSSSASSSSAPSLLCLSIFLMALGPPGTRAATLRPSSSPATSQAANQTVTPLPDTVSTSFFRIILESEGGNNNQTRSKSSAGSLCLSKGNPSSPVKVSACLLTQRDQCLRREDVSRMKHNGTHIGPIVQQNSTWCLSVDTQQELVIFENRNSSSSCFQLRPHPKPQSCRASSELAPMQENAPIATSLLSPTLMVIGGVVCATVVLGSACVALVSRSRRRRYKHQHQHQHQQQQQQLVPLKSAEPVENPCYLSWTDQREILEHVNTKSGVTASEASVKDLISRLKQKSSSGSSKPHCPSQNGIFCMNKPAHFIPFPNGRAPYQAFAIACSAPKLEEMNGFGQILNQASSPVLVSLVSTQDYGTFPNMFPYFDPNCNSSSCPGMSLTPTTTFSIPGDQAYPTLEVQRSRLCLPGGNSSASTPVLWVKNWPDGMPPGSARMLIQLALQLVEHIGPSSMPVVHCVQGLGRTGVFLAVMVMLKEYHLKLPFGQRNSVERIIRWLRESRSSFVVRSTPQLRCLANVAALLGTPVTESDKKKSSRKN